MNAQELLQKLLMILWVFAGLSFCFLGILILRTEVVFRQQMKILIAVYRYSCFCLDSDITPQVELDDVEDFNTTFNRFWDWGYKRILTKEKYEIIKEYIK